MKALNCIVINLLIVVFVYFLVACDSSYGIKYSGIYANNGNEQSGLRNPDRGLRLEIALNVESLRSVFGSSLQDGITTLLESEAQKYASDSITLVQTYFYLTETIGRPLSEKNFETMQVFFDKLRELGMKAVLRFAYEQEFLGRAKSGPTMEDFKTHSRQLKPFLEENKDVIHVMQAGFIGAWGEWHSSFHGHEKSDDSKREILQMIIDMTPDDRMVQVRVPTYKNLLGKDHSDFNRVSFHDDFIIIKPHVWDAGMSEGKNNYEQMRKESPYLVIDGELPWGSWSMNQDPDDPDGGWLIDGEQTARRLFLQHYTSLSAIHNYKERETKDKYSMMYWKETPISQDFLNREKMPVSNDYFQTNDGKPVERNIFDYIRDHLGYRIELQSLEVNSTWKAGKKQELSISLINRGFSTIYNEHPVYYVILNESDDVVYKYLTDVNVNTWQPHDPDNTEYTPLIHTFKATIVLPKELTNGKYRLGLWIPDGSEKLMYNSKYAIRCANGNVEWVVTSDGKYAVNVLDSFSL